jgi:hypothetical protein
MAYLPRAELPALSALRQAGPYDPVAKTLPQEHCKVGTGPTPTSRAEAHQFVPML